MKRSFIIFLLLVIIFSFAACEANNQNKEASDNPTSAFNDTITERLEEDTTATEKQSEEDTTDEKGTGGSGEIVVSYVLDIKDNSDKATGLNDELEFFYTDGTFSYYFDATPKSEYIIVTYSNGESEGFKEAMNSGKVGIQHLDLFGITYTKTLNKSFVSRLASAGKADRLELTRGALNYDKLANDSDSIPVYMLDTLDDLTDFKSNYGKDNAFYYALSDAQSFQKITEEYDESFFNQNSLIIIYFDSEVVFNYTIDSVDFNGNSVCFHISKPDIMYPGKLDAYSGTFLIIEFSDLYLNNNTNIDAKFPKSDNTPIDPIPPEVTPPEVTPPEVTPPQGDKIISDISFESDEPLPDINEVFYSDEKYVYQFPQGGKYKYVIVTYTDGTSENIKDALYSGRATISDLDRFGISYIKQKKTVSSCSATGYLNDKGNYYTEALNADKLFLSSSRSLPVYKFNSLDEFTAFNDRYSLDFPAPEYERDCLYYSEVSSDYDDSFFEDSTLFVIHVQSTYGTPSYSVVDVEIKDGTATFCIANLNCEATDFVISDWFIFIEVISTFVDNCTSFDAILVPMEG